MNVQRTEVQRRFLLALDALIVLGAIATVPLTILAEEQEARTLVQVADWAVWSIFAFEFIARLCLTERANRLDRRTLLPLAVVVLSFPKLPAVLGLVRLARLTRLFRALRLVTVVARGVGGLRIILGRRGVLYVSAVTLLVIIAGGGALALVEPQTVKGGFLDGVWWAVVTASTVGYGDIAPSTMCGRAIAVLMMLAGVGLISTLAASITAYFVGQTESTEIADLRARMGRIEAQLDEIAHLIRADRAFVTTNSDVDRPGARL